MAPRSDLFDQSGPDQQMKVSVVTPTYFRSREAGELLLNLAEQIAPPEEVIIVDGAPPDVKDTEVVVRELAPTLPFRTLYLRSPRGTAIQRNTGIDAACGDLIAFVDDDVRLNADFLQTMIEVFQKHQGQKDRGKRVGGVAGYRTNRHFKISDAQRWLWYRRLHLLATYEPGRYDFETGYPINANMQAPFSGDREVDFMTTACAVWRREVFDAGLRFDLFFRDYGVLEDAHFSLRAGKQWRLLQSGDAQCIELHSPNARVDRRKIGYKCVVNYYFVFQDIVSPLSLKAKVRFWRFQAFEMLRIGASAIRRGKKEDLLDLAGRVEGVAAILRSTGAKHFPQMNTDKHRS
jgi:glycosyltransferase involved in cell wall biosynthesis